MRNILLISLFLFVYGCADTHHLVRSGNSAKLDSTASAYISVPRDGSYGGKNYPGSGLNTTQIVLKGFSAYMTNLETGQEYQSLNEALEYALANRYKYLIYPSILEWEDRATEWSGKPDRVSIKIAVIDVDSGKTIDSAVIDGKSGLATFGGDKPQDLLVKPTEDYVSMLFE